MKIDWKLMGYIVLIIAFLVLIGLYVNWQFNLCYPEVSDNVWYCIQHAAP